MWVWALAPFCFSIVLLCSGETCTWRPLDLGLPDCGTEANELVLFKKLPHPGNSAREAGNWTKWAKGSLCSPLQDYQGFPVPSLIEWESREAWPLAGKGFLTRELAIITFPPIIFTCSSSSGKLSQRSCQNLLRDNRLSVSLLFFTEKGKKSFWNKMLESLEGFPKQRHMSPSPTGHTQATADLAAFHNTTVHWELRFLMSPFWLTCFTWSLAFPKSRMFVPGLPSWWLFYLDWACLTWLCLPRLLSWTWLL